MEQTDFYIPGSPRLVVDTVPLGPNPRRPNLDVFDGSTWPTSSGMNPTATIAAMALRFTEHLIEERRHQRQGR